MHDLYKKKEAMFFNLSRDNIIVTCVYRETIIIVHIAVYQSISLHLSPSHSLWNEQVTPFWKNDFPRFTLTQSLPAFPFVPFHKYSFVVDT